MHRTHAWTLALALFVSSCQSAPVPRVEADGLSFRPHKGWVSEATASTSRVAAYRLPGESEDAHLLVFYFGSGGGSIEANMERWIGQFEQEDGSPTRSVAKIERTADKGLVIHTLDVAGRRVAETSPGSGEYTDIPGMRMMTAIVDTDVGPYYVRLLGTEETVADWAKSFHEFINDLEP